MTEPASESSLSPAQRPLLILGLVVGAALLLLFPLAKPIWTDEWISINWGRQPLYKILTGRFGSPDALPLHPLILHSLGRSLGDTLAVHRLISALPAAIGLWYVWLTARRLGNSVGLLAVWLAALSPGLVLFDRMSRYHGTTALLAVMSCYYFLILCERADKNTLAKYGVVTALMLLSYTLSMFVVAVQFLTLILAWKKTPRPLGIVGAMVVAGALFLAYLIPNFLRASEQLMQLNVEDPSMGQGVNGFLRRFCLPVYVFCVGETLAPWNPLALPGCALALVAFLRGAWTLRARPERLLALACFAVVLLSALATSGKLGGAQTVGSMAKRVSFVLPFFCVTLSSGILSFSRPLVQRAIGATLLAISACSTVNYWRGAEFLNPNYTVDWNGAIAQMKSQRLGADTAIYGSAEPALRHYLDENRFEGPMITSRGVSEMEAQLNASGKRYVWLVGRDRGDRLAVADFEDARKALLASGAKRIYEGGVYPRTKSERFWLGKALKRDVWPTYLLLELYDRTPEKP